MNSKLHQFRPKFDFTVWNEISMAGSSLKTQSKKWYRANFYHIQWQRHFGATVYHIEESRQGAPLKQPKYPLPQKKNESQQPTRALHPFECRTQKYVDHAGSDFDKSNEQSTHTTKNITKIFQKAFSENNKPKTPSEHTQTYAFKAYGDAHKLLERGDDRRIEIFTSETSQQTTKHIGLEKPMITSTQTTLEVMSQTKPKATSFMPGHSSRRTNIKPSNKNKRLLEMSGRHPSVRVKTNEFKSTSNLPKMCTIIPRQPSRRTRETSSWLRNCKYSTGGRNGGAF
jgi:hypothetical protein